MGSRTATATACPNIAFIKYWGDRDSRLHIPANGSISMNLDGLETRTQVTFDEALEQDELSLNGQAATPAQVQRASNFLDHVRRLADCPWKAGMVSSNNFPMGAGVASSASGFAALALAATAALGLALDEASLSRLARLGSGSACRSVPGGFVEWQSGSSDLDSVAATLAPGDHWDLVDCIAILSQGQKAVGSAQGHALANTSPLQAARLADSPLRLRLCRMAILERDFNILANVTELDCQLMHAVMVTSMPPLYYWLSATHQLTQIVHGWRKEGQPVCYTTDAGPNVHVICPAEGAARVAAQLERVPGVLQVLVARPGGAARLI